MTRAETERLNALQAALEAEEHKTAIELWRIREALNHLRQVRAQLRVKKTPAA